VPRDRSRQPLPATATGLGGGSAAQPADLGYRFTQGLHMVSGIAAVPLLFAKLWTVYSRLFAWPPVRSVRHALERLSVGVLVAVVLLEIFTGL
jgi:hypothetical protein